MTENSKNQQAEVILSKLNEDDINMLVTCYLYPAFDGFEEYIKLGERENPPGFKEAIPIMKKLAELERIYKVSLMEELNVPGCVYQQIPSRPIVDTVCIRVPNSCGESIEIKLGRREQLCLDMRDSLYAGSWARMIKEIKSKNNPEQIKYLKIVDNIRQTEENYNLNLGVLMRHWENGKIKMIKGKNYNENKSKLITK